MEQDRDTNIGSNVDGNTAVDPSTHKMEDEQKKEGSVTVDSEGGERENDEGVFTVNTEGMENTTAKNDYRNTGTHTTKDAHTIGAQKGNEHATLIINKEDVHGGSTTDQMEEEQKKEGGCSVTVGKVGEDKTTGRKEDADTCMENIENMENTTAEKDYNKAEHMHGSSSPEKLEGEQKKEYECIVKEGGDTATVRKEDNRTANTEDMENINEQMDCRNTGIDKNENEESTIDNVTDVTKDGETTRVQKEQEHATVINNKERHGGCTPVKMEQLANSKPKISTHEMKDTQSYSSSEEVTLADIKCQITTNQESNDTHKDLYTTDDDIPLTSFITKHLEKDQVQTETDDSLPLATLRTKSKQAAVVLKKKQKQYKKEITPSKPDNIESDSSISDSDEYESDVSIEHVLDELGSSSSDSDDESDCNYDASDAYSALRWSDKLRGITEHPFIGPTPGPRRQLSKTCTPLDQFFELFPESLFKLMTESTEAYVPIYQAKKRQKDPTWTDTIYKPISNEMIRAYLGIRMIMAVDPKPSLADYWSTNPSLRNERIAKTMSRDRFVNIQRYFHINDPRQDPARQSGENAEAQRKKDPLYKVSPLMEGVRKQSKRLYNLHQQISIDEAMIKCHGQHWGIVGAPNKPAKRGFKIFVLADAVSGYMSDFMVYLRKQKEVGLTQNVETLVEPIEERNHIIFVDKFYTSVPLALSLIEKGTFISGSFNQSCRFWPSDLKISKTKKKKDDKLRNLKRGESMARQTKDGKLLATVWKDKKHVYNLNTYYDTLYNRRECTVMRKERNMEGKWRRLEFPCPKPIVEFNKYMDGVDRHDHLRSNYSLQRSCSRWWTYFAWFAIDLALINAFLLYKHVHPKAKHKKFHLKVAEQLIGGFCDRKRVPRQSDADELFLATANHEQDIMPGRAKACRLCLQLGKRTPSGRPKETNHGCIDCKVNLHRDCFAAYHDVRRRKSLTLDAYTQTGEVFLTPTKSRHAKSINEKHGAAVKSTTPAKRPLIQGVKRPVAETSSTSEILVSKKRKPEQSMGTSNPSVDTIKNKKIPVATMSKERLSQRPKRSNQKKRTTKDK